MFSTRLSHYSSMYKTLVFQHINTTGARVTGHVVRQGGPSSGVIDQGRGQVDTIKDASALVTDHAVH